MEKEYSLSKNTKIILKKDSCQLLASDRALSTLMQFKCLHKCILCKGACVLERDFASNQQINKRGRIMNDKIQYDRIIIFFYYFNMRTNENRIERKKKKKRKYLSCESMSAFIVVFLIKINKVLTAVIHKYLFTRLIVKCENTCS